LIESVRWRSSASLNNTEAVYWCTFSADMLMVSTMNRSALAMDPKFSRSASWLMPQALAILDRSRQRCLMVVSE
jgi:hypothetical protein